MKSVSTLVGRGMNTDLKVEEELSQAWQAIFEGRGSREDAELAFSDLAAYSGYFSVSPSGTSGEQQLRAEGRRDVMARIIFLLDLPFTRMTELRRAATDTGFEAASLGLYGE